VVQGVSFALVDLLSESMLTISANRCFAYAQKPAK